MKIHSESLIGFPIELVYETYRDRLPEMVAYMPDVKKIEVLSRKDGEKGPLLHNRWHASTELPAVLKPVIKPEMMRWDDFATWDDQARHVDWRIELATMKEQVRCSGRNRFIAEGDSTRVILTGDLQIDLKKVPGVPGFMAGKIAPQVEKFIVMLITPNLQKVNSSLEDFLKAQKG